MRGSIVDQVDPQGPEDSEERVLRGGWRFCQSAYRYLDQPYFSFRSTGFRIVLELTEEDFLRYAKQYRPG
jgi:hypothetical protein